MPENVQFRSPYHPLSFVKFEASGLRTALAAVLPLILGQMFGYASFGLFVGIAGLYLSVSDKQGATIISLSAVLVVNALAMFSGTLVGNDLWLSMITLFIIAFAGGMMSAFGEAIGQMGFVATLTFAVALGQASDLASGEQRFVAFLVGGCFSLVLTVILWSMDQQTSSAIDETDAQKEIEQKTRSNPLIGLWAEMTPHSIIFRHAMRLAIASSVAIGVYKYFALEHGYWLIITVLVIVKPIFADTRRRAVERVTGSVAGGIFAVIVAAFVRDLAVIDVLLVVFSVLAFSHVRSNYGVYVFFLTPFVVLMIDTVVPGDWQIALVRILNTIIGGAIALAVTYLLRPRPSTRPQVSTASP